MARRRRRSGSRRSSARRWRDFGYDVADYCDVDPLFGTLADFDALVARAARARPQADRRLRPQPHLGPSIRGSSRRARRATTRSATGTSGATRRPDGGPPNNWLATFGGPAWTWDDARPASTTCTLPAPSSRTSTGATPRSARRCSTCCASGSSAASTASASTSLPSSSRTPSCATTRRTRAGARAHDPYGALRPHVYDQTSPRCTRSSRELRARSTRRAPTAGARAHRRDLPADRAARHATTATALRAPPAVQLPAAHDAVAGAARSRALVARYERACRPAPGRTGSWATTTSPGSPRASARAQAPRRGDAAADAARHADALLRRRDRHGRRADPAELRVDPLATTARRRPRPAAHADAVGRRAERRVHDGRAVAADRPGRRRVEVARQADNPRSRCSR